MISQLRTGYIELNDYLQKCSIKKNPTCECWGERNNKSLLSGMYKLWNTKGKHEETTF